MFVFFFRFSATNINKKKDNLFITFCFKILYNFCQNPDFIKEIDCPRNPVLWLRHRICSSWPPNARSYTNHHKILANHSERLSRHPSDCLADLLPGSAVATAPPTSGQLPSVCSCSTNMSALYKGQHLLY